MKSLRPRQFVGGRLALSLLAALALPGAMGPARAQVGILADGSPRTWSPGIVLRLGESMDVMGQELALALDPLASFQSGQKIPGGALAPLRFRTGLEVSVRSAPGNRPLPMKVAGPAGGSMSPGTPAGDELPLLGPGAEYLFFRSGATSGPWAYARVLEVGADRVRLELATCRAGDETILRDPIALEVEGGSWLSWASRDDDGQVANAPRYDVARRAVGTAAWEDLAEVATPDADGVYRWSLPARLPDAPVVQEYRVTRVDGMEALSPQHVGAFLRFHPFGDGVTTVAPGSRIDLVSGQTVEPSVAAHATVGRAAPGAIVLKPGEGVRFSHAVSSKRKVGLKARASAGTSSGTTSRASVGVDGSWRLPVRSDSSWLPGKAVMLRDGGELVFLLENGLRGRVSATEVGSERWLLRRELSIDDSGLLPRPPAAPMKLRVDAPDTPDGGARLLLSLARPHADSGVPPSEVSFVLEYEAAIGTGEWEVLAVTGAGTTSFDLPGAFVLENGGRRPILRLRLRHRVRFGSESAPGEAFDVLSSGGDALRRHSDLDVALVKLASEDFGERLEARAVIEAIGDEARPSLEALAITGGASPGGLAALELLRALEMRGGGGVRLAAQLRVQALESLQTRGFSPELGDLDSWLGEMPAGLASARAEVRSHTLLLAADRAERGVALAGSAGMVADDCRRALAWAHATATLDPDEGVRWLARFLGEIGLVPSTASFEPEGPAWLLPLERRASPERLDFGWGEQPPTAEELRWQLEARPELASLELGFALARLHAALGASDRYVNDVPLKHASGDFARGATSRLFDYDARTAELVLRLIERARGQEADPVLLEAAQSLLPGERWTLEAWRSVSDRRLASPSPSVPGRRRIELETPDLRALEAVLTELDGSTGVDLVLSGGDWAQVSGEPGKGKESEIGRARMGSTTLELRVDDVRLIAAEGAQVRIHAGLRIYGRNVVLENLVVTQSMGQAITVLDGGHAVALGCELRGTGTVLHLQHGDLELYECRVEPADPASPASTAARLILKSRLIARATLFNAGSLFVSSGGDVWMDRCVLDAGSRMLIQSQERGRVFIRESLLRGEGSGLFRVSSGILAGTVIDVPRDPLGRLPQSLQDGGLRVSPRLLRLVQEGQEVPPAMQLDSEPLGTRFRGLEESVPSGR